METQQDILTAVHRAATKGARAITTNVQVVADAAQAAIERCEDALLTKKCVRQWQAWAFRVGANAAKRLLRRHRMVSCLAPGRDAARLRDSAMANGESVAGNDNCPRFTAQRVLAELRRLSVPLRGRAEDVVRKLFEPDMTVRQAARDLATTPYAVRRTLASIANRVRMARQNH
jgi:DNA-directed RNA polymerase specialized sigma24 family protein